jgi:hypothetical protein
MATLPPGAPWRRFHIQRQGSMSFWDISQPAASWRKARHDPQVIWTHLTDKKPDALWLRHFFVVILVALRRCGRGFCGLETVKPGIKVACQKRRKNELCNYLKLFT